MSAKSVDAGQHSRLAELGQRVLAGGTVRREEGLWLFNLENGADIFLEKPFTKQQLFDSVKSLLN